MPSLPPHLVDAVDLNPAAAAAAQSALVKIRIVAWSGFSVVMWELITHSPQELKMWMGRKTAATVSFLVARWAGVMVLVLALVNINATGHNCQAVHFFVFFFYAVMSSAVSYVFCCRVLALYHMDRRMAIGLNIAFALLLGSWVASLAGLRAVPTGRAIAGSACLNRDPEWFILGWAASVAFDFVVLLATIYKVYQVQVRGEVLDYLRKSSIIYFISILACNTSVLVTNFASGSAGYARVMPIPITCAFQIVVVSRLTLGLLGRSNGRNIGNGGASSDAVAKGNAASSRDTSSNFGFSLRGLGSSFSTRSQKEHPLTSGIRFQTTVVTTRSPADTSDVAASPTTIGLSALSPPAQPYMPITMPQERGLPTTRHAYANPSWRHDPEKGSF